MRAAALEALALAGVAPERVWAAGVGVDELPAQPTPAFDPATGRCSSTGT